MIAPRPRGEASRRAPLRPPLDKLALRLSAPAAPASTRPAAATASATPGHATIGWLPAEERVARLASSATTKPRMAATQPDTMRTSRRGSAAATNGRLGVRTLVPAAGSPAPGEAGRGARAAE